MENYRNILIGNFEIENSTMKIKIDKKFIKRINGLTLFDVKYGIAKGWIEADVAIDVVLKAIENNNYREIDVQLAILSEENILDIQDLLATLEPHSEEFQKNKWLKILIAWFYEHRSEFEDPLQTIEELYADFDYPESIEHLVRYMPSDGPIKNLFDEWKFYVKNEVYSELINPLQIRVGG